MSPKASLLRLFSWSMSLGTACRRAGNLLVSTALSSAYLHQAILLALLFHDNGGPLAAALADETVLGGTDHDCQDADLYAR